MTELKLYHIHYTVQKYQRLENGERGEYIDHSGATFRLGRDSQEAIKSFNQHIAPQLKSSLESVTRNAPSCAWYVDMIRIDYARKVDSVQDHRIVVR